MKKILLLAAVSATGLLASCGGGSIPAPSGYYGGYNPSASASLNPLSSYTTNWTYNNQYVICKDRETKLYMNLSWDGYLQAAGFQLKGYDTGNFVNTNAVNINANSGSTQVTITLAAGMAPLSIKTGAQPGLKAQSIVANPINLGYTYVRSQGIDGNGNYTNIVTTEYAIPVMNCQ